MDGSFLLASESLVGLHTAYYRAGMELFVYLYAEEPELVSSWLQALNDYELYKIHRIADPKLMPVAMVADDLAYNKGLLFSREFLMKESFPRAKRLVDAWHQHGCKVIFFCDGNKWDIMDDLIAIGYDCIAPLEPASNMTVKDVKEKYPQLTNCYMIDCNDLLSHGTSEQVDAEVKQAIDAAAGGGGFILSSTSAIHPAVKLENAIRMFEVARTYGVCGQFSPAHSTVKGRAPAPLAPSTGATPAKPTDRMAAADRAGSLESIKQAVIDGDWQNIGQLVQRALDQGVPIQAILDEGMSGAMSVVGDFFSDGTYFIPNLILSAKTMKLGMEVIKPLFKVEGAARRGRVVIGTIQGDIHDIGKNLVASMLEGAGYDVIDLGFDVKVEEFVAAVREHRPDVVAMSGILTTTVNHMPGVVQALQEAGLRQSVLVAMGGTCATPQFPESSGADIFAPDAASAVKVVERAVVKRRRGRA
jgi:5-methyltetrahydrofolate--homocysteine methyltransferase